MGIFGKKKKEDQATPRTVEELMGDKYLPKSEDEGRGIDNSLLRHTVETEKSVASGSHLDLGVEEQKKSKRNSLFSLQKSKKVEAEDDADDVIDSSLDREIEQDTGESSDVAIKSLSEDKTKKLYKLLESISGHEVHKSVFLLTSLDGTGARTIAAAVARELSKKERVLLVDFDVFNPKIGRYVRLNVTADKSITNYFSGASELKHVLVRHESNAFSDGNENIYVASSTFLDNWRAYSNIIAFKFNHFFSEARSAFDYIIVTTPYHPYSEFFAYTITNADKGVFIWDEQWCSSLKTNYALSNIRKYRSSSPFQHVIINKRTSYNYDFESITKIGCDLICEVPMVLGAHALCNDGKLSLDDLHISKGNRKSLIEFFSK